VFVRTICAHPPIIHAAAIGIEKDLVRECTQFSTEVGISSKHFPTKFEVRNR
jgi:hypothetical protein